MRILTMTAALLALLGVPAAAQQMNIAGQWTCEMGFQNTAPGQPANAVGQRFNMALYPNGMAQGGGIEMGSSGQFQFQFQAQWQMQGRTLYVQGQKNGGLAFQPVSEFSFQSNVTGPNSMAYTERYQNGQVYASQCQRTG